MSDSKIILVTGATDGIGKQTALALAKRGHQVILHGRSAAKLEQTRRDLEAQGLPVLDALQADLSDLDQVRQLAQTLRQAHPRLDVLLNNAGIYARDYARSAQGFELTLAVNHLAPFLLTHHLMDLLLATDQARVINVSSLAHGRGRLNLEDLNMERGFDAYQAYAQSKLANVMFTVALARRVDPTKLTTHALHPGVVSTKLLTEGFGFEGPDSLEDGAQTSVFLALDPVGAAQTGGYFAACKPARVNPLAEDEALTERLYEISAAMTSLEPELRLPRRDA